MSDNTGIEWTDATWNPVRGCSRVSPGCQHCYAETVAGRFCGAGQPYEGLIHPTTRGWNGKVKLVPEAFQIPWRWTRGRRIFVNSMSDLFHPSVPFEFIAAVFFIMSVTTRHQYQVLTKRPERMLEFFHWVDDYEHVFPGERISDVGMEHPAVKALGWDPCRGGRGGYDNCGPGFPYENVWLGVSVENQATADERIPLLLQCPAAVRWISAEPLLGRVDLCEHLGMWWNQTMGSFEGSGQRINVHPRGGPGIGWLVAGGESGIGARPMHPEWARSLRDQCAAAGVPFLFKQWGAWQPISEMTSSEHLYRSNRCARGGQSQIELDDVYGRTCTVDTAVLQADGNHGPLDLPNAFRPGAVLGFNVGKKAAGRLLDGQLHDGYPADPHA